MSHSTTIHGDDHYEYRGFNIELSTNASICFPDGKFFGSRQISGAAGIDTVKQAIDKYIADQNVKSITVDISEDEVNAIMLAAEALNTGLIETEFNLSGLNRIKEKLSLEFKGET
jgi:hypothetical protein